MINLSLDQKIDLFAARNCTVPESYRSIEKRLEIDHSTLHYMLPRINTEIAEALKRFCSGSKEDLVRVVVAMAMTGQMSSRSIASCIELIFKVDISHDVVLDILAEAGQIAAGINLKELNLKNVRTALFDEIFQSNKPLLVFVDHRSALICLKAVEDRSAETWAIFLELLKSMGLDPNVAITDGGTGLKSALILSFGSDIVYVLDLFHFLKKLSDAKRKMEGICYCLINAVDEMLKDQTDKRTSGYKKTEEKMRLAIDLFDKFELLCQQVAIHAYLTDKNTGKYVTSDELKKELIQIAEILKTFFKQVRKHRKINDARSYIENNIDGLTLYKKTIEEEIRREFPAQAQLILDYFLPVIEGLDQYEQSYEDAYGKKYWAQKIIELKRTLLDEKGLTEADFNNLLNSVNDIVSAYAKSNALVENINNQIRRFLDTYKTIPGWFCDLFSFYWNFRVLRRGKRKGFAPIELLKGKKLAKSWLDLIAERFPYEKLRSSL